MVLQAKNLKYRVIEIIPGIGQIGIFRLSGQRQVPVLVDGDTVVPDSSTIIRYIEAEHPNPKLMPDNPKQAAQLHLIEYLADTTLAKLSIRACLTQLLLSVNSEFVFYQKSSQSLGAN